MERLYKIVGLVFGAACSFVASPSPIVAQDYCSLKVRVVTPADVRPDIPVVVKEKNGRTIEKDQDLDSEDVSFCDLGILTVTVIVGQVGCNQITVEGVPLSWQKTYTLVVNYDYGACMNESVPSPVPYCNILLRVMGPDGKWIKAAKIKLDDPALPERETDSAGRSLVFLKLNGHVQGSVSAQGYSKKNFSLGCSAVSGREEILILDKGEASFSNKGKKQGKDNRISIVR